MNLIFKNFLAWEKTILKFSIAVSLVLAISGLIIGNTIALFYTNGVSLKFASEICVGAFIGFLMLGSILNFIVCFCKFIKSQMLR